MVRAIARSEPRSLRRVPCAAPAAPGAPSGAVGAAAAVRRPRSTSVRHQQAVDAHRVRREAADEGAGDLAEGEEDAVEAHDRAAVVGVGLGDVGEQPQRGGCRAREDEQPGDGDHGQCHGDRRRHPGAVVDRDGRGDQRGAPHDAPEDDRGPAQRLEPVAPVDEAGEEDQQPHAEADADRDRVEAPHEHLVGEPRDRARGPAGTATASSRGRSPR